MPLRSQKQVMVNLDRMSGLHMKRAGKRYREETIEPLLNAIRNAGSGQEALQRLGPSMLHRMDSTALEEAVTDDHVQAALVGRASALPRERATERRSDVAT